MIQKITEKTLFPLSLVITIGAAVWWASSLQAQVRAHQEAITDLEQMGKDIAEIKTDLAIVKFKLFKEK